jgi:hypothetical protein
VLEQITILFSFLFFVCFFGFFRSPSESTVSYVGGGVSGRDEHVFSAAKCTYMLPAGENIFQSGLDYKQIQFTQVKSKPILCYMCMLWVGNLVMQPNLVSLVQNSVKVGG